MSNESAVVEAVSSLHSSNRWETFAAMPRARTPSLSNCEPKDASKLGRAIQRRTASELRTLMVPFSRSPASNFCSAETADTIAYFSPSDLSSGSALSVCWSCSNEARSARRWASTERPVSILAAAVASSFAQHVSATDCRRATSRFSHVRTRLVSEASHLATSPLYSLKVIRGCAKAIFCLSASRPIASLVFISADNATDKDCTLMLLSCSWTQRLQRGRWVAASRSLTGIPLCCSQIVQLDRPTSDDGVVPPAAAAEEDDVVCCVQGAFTNWSAEARIWLHPTQRQATAASHFCSLAVFSTQLSQNTWPHGMAWRPFA